MSRVVVVRGAGFVNKGAELMLRAVIQNLEDKGYIVAADLRCGSFKQRSELGIYHLPWLFIGKLAPSTSMALQRITDRAFAVLPRTIRHTEHIACEADVSAVLDASGFRYTDQNGLAGEKIAQFTALNVARWRKEGKSIIFLPQAFGPFTNRRIAQAVTTIVENSNCVFARDITSLEHLRDLCVDSPNIKLAPDFTCLVRGIRPDYFDVDKKRPCVIPNSRMLDTTSKTVSESYMSFLVTSISYLIEQELEPFILIHEENDIGLGKEIQRQLSNQVNLIWESNPLYIKGMLGNCSFVISSRYHGLINALSQGVPCLATTWSHKYQMLLEDYNCADCLVSLPASDSEIRYRIDRVSRGPSREDLLERLAEAGSRQRKLVSEMWSEVHAVLSAGR